MTYLERACWLPIKWSRMVFLVKFAQVNKPRLFCNKLLRSLTSTSSSSPSHSAFPQLTRISRCTPWLKKKMSQWSQAWSLVSTRINLSIRTTLRMIQRSPVKLRQFNLRKIIIKLQSLKWFSNKCDQNLKKLI
jgi:hypothetical protein